MNVLLVEDCQEVAEIIFDYFENTNIELDYAATGTLGLRLATEQHFDCIILDIMLPGLDGLTLCQQLRKKGKNTPIIMLTARDTSLDIKQGLNLGADDYLVKPFDIEILEARIHSLVRRSSGSGFKTCLHCGTLKLDLQNYHVWRDDRTIKLNPSCFKILKLLMERSPALATRQEIEQTLWPEGVPDQDILRKHIYQLRTKIDKPFQHDMIETVPKLGYRIMENS